jgi:hypothetical protein
MNIVGLRQEQLQALDDLLDLLDEADVLFRAGKLKEAQDRVDKARKMAAQVRRAASPQEHRRAVTSSRR